MRARRGGLWQQLGCALLIGGCGPGPGAVEPAAPPANKVDTAAAPPPAAAPPVAPAPPAGDSVEALLQVFARSNIADVAGDGFFRKWALEFLASLPKDDEGGPLEIVFVVDRSLSTNAAQSLAFALAGARAKLANSARTGLVTFAAQDGAWVTRVEAPLGSDLPTVIRAATRVDWHPDGGAGMVGSWAALAEVTRLDWRADPKRRHIVLLLDDREPRAWRFEERPRDDPALRSSVAVWAPNATLHVVRCMLELADGGGRGYDGRPYPGVPLHVVAGLVRDGHYTQPDSPPALAAAVAGALDGLGETPADVVLVVDRTGLMGESLAGLRALRPALDHFVAGPGHRLALVRWDREGAAVVARLTARAGAVPGALRALRRGQLGDRPKHLFVALASAQGLAWEPTARKVVLVLTAAPTFLDPETWTFLEWTDSDAITLHVIEPTAGAIASSRAP